MRLEELVDTSARVGATRGRLRKAELLAELLGGLSAAEIPIAAAWLTGELLQGRIGLGPAVVRELDGGPPAAAGTLELADVDRAFAEVAAITGAGSKARRSERLDALLAAATEPERDFLRRLMVGELRHGALEGVLVEAVARAAELPADEVRRAAMVGGALREVAATALLEGAAGLARFRLEVGRAVLPMLAQPAPDVAAALERLGRAAFEWKLDGARVHVHRQGDEVRVFTRRLHEVTRAVPELVEQARGFDAESFVLDGEALALDADGRPRPFQETMRRFTRKRNVDAMRRELPLTTVFFDLLSADGLEWLERPAQERRAELERIAGPPACVERLVTDDEGQAQAFYARALERGYEGLVAKALDSRYEAGRRGSQWLKLKPAHTLDLVVLAAEWGSGRREGRLSNLHLGARDPAEEGRFVMLGKTFKGMTDAVLEQQTEALLAREVERDGHVVHVRPELVVEVAFDGVQRSPQYPGEVALRFARLVRYRADKSAAEADTIDAVRALLP